MAMVRGEPLTPDPPRHLDGDLVRRAGQRLANGFRLDLAADGLTRLEPALGHRLAAGGYEHRLINDDDLVGRGVDILSVRGLL